MIRGIELRHDADYDYVIRGNRDVEIRVGGEVDYIGKLFGYSKDTIVLPNGDRYLRGIVQVRTM